MEKTKAKIETSTGIVQEFAEVWTADSAFTHMWNIAGELRVSDFSIRQYKRNPDGEKEPEWLLVKEASR